MTLNIAYFKLCQIIKRNITFAVKQHAFRYNNCLICYMLYWVVKLLIAVTGKFRR